MMAPALHISNLMSSNVIICVSFQKDSENLRIKISVKVETVPESPRKKIEELMFSLNNLQQDDRPYYISN